MVQETEDTLAEEMQEFHTCQNLAYGTAQWAEAQTRPMVQQAFILGLIGYIPHILKARTWCLPTVAVKPYVTQCRQELGRTFVTEIALWVHFYFKSFFCCAPCFFSHP